MRVFGQADGEGDAADAAAHDGDVEGFGVLRDSHDVDYSLHFGIDSAHTKESGMREGGKRKEERGETQVESTAAEKGRMSDRYHLTPTKVELLNNNSRTQDSSEYFVLAVTTVFFHDFRVVSQD